MIKQRLIQYRIFSVFFWNPMLNSVCSPIKQTWSTPCQWDCGRVRSISRTVCLVFNRRTRHSNTNDCIASSLLAQKNVMPQVVSGSVLSPLSWKSRKITEYFTPSTCYMKKILTSHLFTMSRLYRGNHGRLIGNFSLHFLPQQSLFTTVCLNLVMIIPPLTTVGGERHCV